MTDRVRQELYLQEISSLFDVQVSTLRSGLTTRRQAEKAPEKPSRNGEPEAAASEDALQARSRGRAIRANDTRRASTSETLREPASWIITKPLTRP